METTNYQQLLDLYKEKREILNEEIKAFESINDDDISFNKIDTRKQVNAIKIQLWDLEKDIEGIEGWQAMHADHKKHHEDMNDQQKENLKALGEEANMQFPTLIKRAETVLQSTTLDARQKKAIKEMVKFHIKHKGRYKHRTGFSPENVRAMAYGMLNTAVEDAEKQSPILIAT